MPALTRIARWAPFAAASTTHVVALATGRPRLAAVTKLMLMPALLPPLADGRPLTRSRTVALTAAGLGLSWVGDNAPVLLDNPRLDPHHDPDDADAVPIMAAGFAAAHAAYVAAFAPAARRRPPWGSALAYATLGTALARRLAPRAGKLQPVVVGYAGAVATMATVAAAAGPEGRAGGAAFFASDATLALRLFEPRPWAKPWLVLALYCAGQGLLVEAARRQAESR